MTTPIATSTTDSQMHNNIMAAGSRDRPPMLAIERYAQWKSRFLRYIDTRPNDDALRKCILEGPYQLTFVTILAVPEAIHLLLTGIGDEIYSIVDACKTAHEMWIAIKKATQYQKEVNKIRVERIAKNDNLLALVAAASPYPDPYFQAPKSHKPYAPTSKQSSSTRSNASTKFKGKEIAKPITPPSESASEEESDLEQAQRDKDLQKNLALIVKYFKKIYKPTNNNLRTSSNSRNKNMDTSPWKPKRVKDSTYHKEKMLLCKQAEKGVPLQAEQSDWLADTDEEIDEQELEAHYSFMAKIQEVPTADSGTDTEPLEQVQYDAEYNVFANERQHSEQPESISNTCVVEKVDSNVIPDSPDMCDNDIQTDQNVVECDDERVVLANLIVNLKLDVDENKNIQKQLKKSNTSLAHELKECKSILAKTSRTLGETKKPKVVPISTRKPKSQANKSIATYHKKTVASESTIKNSKSYYRMLYEKTNKTWKWWIEQQCPSGYKWVPKTKKKWVPKVRNENLQKRVSFAIDNASRITNIVQLILFIIDSGCTKHMTGNLSLLCNFVEKYLGTVCFGNDQFAPILGYGDFFKEILPSTGFTTSKGNDLLTGNRGTDLYTISLQETTSSTPICLMAKASPTQAWLWHRRLSHLPPFTFCIAIYIVFIYVELQCHELRAVMAQRRATTPSIYHSLLPTGTPPLLPIPLPVPSISRRDDILEADTPPRKRLLLTAPTPRVEDGESSAAASRQLGSTMAHRVDHSFVDTVDTRVRDTERKTMAAIEVVNLREDRATVRAEIEILRIERLAYEQESIETRQDLARSEAYSRALEARIRVLETQAYRHEWQRQDADDRAIEHIIRTQALEVGARVDTLEIEFIQSGFSQSDSPDEIGGVTYTEDFPLPPIPPSLSQSFHILPSLQAPFESDPEADLEEDDDEDPDEDHVDFLVVLYTSCVIDL
ncbi:hypothetical protein Tco_1449608 [Tanacetum coccineum]